MMKRFLVLLLFLSCSEAFAQQWKITPTLPNVPQDQTILEADELHGSRKLDGLVQQVLVTPVQTMAQNAISVGYHAYPTASYYLSHYISNKGTDVKINMDKLIREDLNTHTNLRVAIDGAVRFAEENWTRLQILNSFVYEPMGDSMRHPDWFNAIGLHSHWANAATGGEGVKATRRSLTIWFSVEDVYDFDIQSKDGVLQLGHSSPILKDAELAALHYYGAARAFRVTGRKQYNVSWTKGDRGNLVIDPPLPPRPQRSRRTGRFQ